MDTSIGQGLAFSYLNSFTPSLTGRSGTEQFLIAP
jgi:hypothetical protein